MDEPSPSFAQVFVLNLFAAYVPAVFWVPYEDLGQGGNRLLLFVLSPVAFPALLSDSPGGYALPVCFWGICVFLIYKLSEGVYRSKGATVFFAGVIFIVSLFQGLWFSAAVRGLDAVGRS